jgi:hypothetical protein
VTRFRLDHPTRVGVHAIYGHDPVLAFFVDVMREGRDKPLASYDTWHPTFNRERPLLGCVDFLASEGFFTRDKLNDALVVVADDLDVPKRLVRVVEVIERFKAEGG